MAIGYALLAGLRINLISDDADSMTLVDVEQLPEPPPPESETMPDRQEEGAASPPDLLAEASPVVAPEPAVPVPRRPPIAAAPEPNDGLANSQGAAERPGPGTGAGGVGEGFGRGSAGGGAGGGRAVVRARHVAGEITPADFPASARQARAFGTVGANVDIGRDGRVTACTIAQSSGDPALDAATCRLIRERFRYEPARNASGETVPDRRGWRQRWCLGRSDCSVD